jgi:hypothetical protein
MKALFGRRILCLSAAIACAMSPGLRAQIANGGFEAGLGGWTSADQVGSDGTFFWQIGTASPVNGDPVPAPPGGLYAAMTDAQGPGSHVLYQNITFTAPVSAAVLEFDVFVGNRSDAFRTPNTLDFSTPTLNQQGRVDILLGSANPFSLVATDLLLNAYRTNVGDPLISGYTHKSVDITALVNSHLNTPLMLRLAEVDNVFTFQFGLDNLTIVPEPASLAIIAAGALMLMGRRSLRLERRH